MVSRISFYGLSSKSFALSYLSIQLYSALQISVLRTESAPLFERFLWDNLHSPLSQYCWWKAPYPISGVAVLSLIASSLPSVKGLSTRKCAKLLFVTCEEIKVIKIANCEMLHSVTIITVSEKLKKSFMPIQHARCMSSTNLPSYEKYAFEYFTPTSQQ